VAGRATCRSVLFGGCPGTVFQIGSKTRGKNRSWCPPSFSYALRREKLANSSVTFKVSALSASGSAR
jgi:hypothetical protein